MFDKEIKTIQEANNKAGFLEAIQIVSKMTMESGHPIESETLDRVFDHLQAEYTERWKGSRHEIEN